MATLLAVSVAGIVPSAESVVPSTSDGTSPRVLARQSAQALVKSRAPQLKMSAGDTVVAGKVISGAGGLQYAPYSRTYKGLEVLGGDFVVTTDAQGRILGTSVAQTRRIGSIATTPEVSRRAAAKAARTTVDTATRIGTPTRAVYALGTPSLVWNVRVNGLHEDGDREIKEVYVDARTGKVLGERMIVDFADGTGTGHFNGPNPLTVRTTQNSASSYSMIDPDIPGVSCRDDAAAAPYTGGDNAWGNGMALDRETACVDSLYAIQTEDAMISAWLGGNGFDTQGRGWQVSVGKDMVNAFYCPPGYVEAGYCDGTQRVRIGHNQNGTKWLSSMDVVGHEFGHGVDANTPGGISNGGTQEFVADVFGALTEAYANQSASYDPPDYAVGEEIDLLGDGNPFRYMYNPSLAGDPNCYSSSVPNSEVHGAAGPGNHWFYLLAEGSAPAGKPASPVCSGGALTGIGIQTAGKIFYSAMLMKTSASSYGKYRVWTLTAAKNLYPGDCTNFDKVKAAWDAVSLGAQVGEPTCTVAGNTVTVTNPGNKTGTVGTAASLQLTGSSTGAGQTLTWSATGLPAGLSINATTGLISGTPTTAGTYSVTATAKDTTNATGSTTFTWTINPAGGTGWTPTLANTIALSNCSGSLVRFPASLGTDKAMLLTNGHCLPTMPTAGQVITNQAASRTGTLLKGDGTSAGTVTADQIIYATMTGTDVTLYRLNETFDALRTRTSGVPYTIANAKPATGASFAIPSSYHKRIWDNCSIDGFTNLKEASWSFTDSIRYNDTCDTIAGTSGSPIVSKVDGQVIGINNTGNENGEMCTMNNPCEVAADGTTSVRQGTSYGQQTWWFTTCLNSSRQVDLTVSGCKLTGATTTPPPSGNLLKNPGFESGAVDWSGTTGVINTFGPAARTGSWKAYLGGNGTTATENLVQSVSIPATATSATLTFWTSITTAETTTATVYDTLRVQVIDGTTTSTLATYSNLSKTSGYVQKTINLTAYKGKTISLKLLMNEDSSLQTTFLVDDTALNVS